MLTVEVLQRFPEARERWAKAFRYVLVDEYQDTNHAQYVLLQLLASVHQKPDGRRRPGPDRSIRSGAPTSATSSSSSATSPTRRVIPLEQNYRSTNAILNAANAVIEHNRERKEKRLWSELGEGEPVRVVEAEDEHAEARFVAAEVAGARRVRHEPRRDRGRLPDERAEPRARGRARPAGGRLPGDRRAAVLRARRDQGRDRLPAGDRQPVRRRLADADREPAAARGGGHLARAAAGARRRRGDLALGGGRPRRGGRPRDRVAEGRAGLALAPPVADGGGAGALDRGAPRARDRAHRLPGVPAHDAAEVGGRGEDREPRGARRRRARVRGGGRASRRSRRSCRRSRSTPTRTRCATTRAAGR